MLEDSELNVQRLSVSRHGLGDVWKAAPPANERKELWTYTTNCSAFGVARQYRLPKEHTVPYHDPDQLVTELNVADAPQVLQTRKDSPIAPMFGPFTTESAFSLAEWYWQSSKKSFSDFQKLLTVLQAPSFSMSDISSVNWKSTFNALGSNKDDLSEEDGSWIRDDGWKSTEISIDVPFHNWTKDPGFKRYVVGKLKHRSIISVIKEKLSNRTRTRDFHYYPYTSTWKRTSDSPEVNLYGELYASQAFRDAHAEVQRKPTTDVNKGLERIVVALMFWSDETHLTAFGGASLWPCYMFFGNESKYSRGEPSKSLGEHIAYFLQVRRL